MPLVLLLLKMLHLPLSPVTAATVAVTVVAAAAAKTPVAAAAVTATVAAAAAVSSKTYVDAMAVAATGG
jgi:hypothetical protein